MLRRVLVVLIIATSAFAVVLHVAHADPSFDQRLYADTQADGCQQHSWDGVHAAYAQQRAQYIADTGDFSHNGWSPPGGQGAENIGWTSGVTDPTAAADYVNQSYMNSADHHANICDPRWRSMGIGSVFRSSWKGMSDVWINAEEFGNITQPAPQQPPTNLGVPGVPSRPDNSGGIAVPGTGGSG